MVQVCRWHRSEVQATWFRCAGGILRESGRRGSVCRRHRAEAQALRFRLQAPWFRCAGGIVQSALGIVQVSGAMAEYAGGIVGVLTRSFVPGANSGVDGEDFVSTWDARGPIQGNRICR
jgi:hypothetical protein